MHEETNITRAARQLDLCLFRGPCWTLDSDVAALSAAGLGVASRSTRFSLPTIVGLLASVAGFATSSAADAQTPLFPTLPRGTYVAAQYTCARYLEVGLMRLDDQGFSPPKTNCKVVSADEASGTYQSVCREKGSPEDEEHVTLKIEQVSKQSVRLNGVVYNYCKGL